MRLALVPLLALALVALGAARCDENDVPSPTPTPVASGSGIEGTVTIGPMCPVEREDSPCPDQPYQATIVIENEDGGEVARAQSAADGVYRVDIAPGTYTVVPQSPDNGGLPYAAEQQVEVRAGEYARVDIPYDSGIR